MAVILFGETEGLEFLFGRFSYALFTMLQVPPTNACTITAITCLCERKNSACDDTLVWESQRLRTSKL